MAVACSGGRDSIALLHATLSAAAPIGLRVVALHVHHGLSAQADAWLASVESRCHRWVEEGALLGFAFRRLRGRPGKGESVEAWARRGRYAALAEMAREHGAGLVLLAHHRLDQAETLLLQALRGAGPAGLAAMPAVIEREGLVWARPWLSRPRDQIEAYVRHHGLAFVDDDSNTATRFARNRLRHHVWPALVAAFPDADATLAAAAGRAAEATAALDEVAEADLVSVSVAADLRISRLLQLSPARRALVLRRWLQARGANAAPETLVRRLVAEVSTTGTHRWPALGGSVHQARGRLVYLPEVAPPSAAPEATLSIRRAGRHALPGWGGHLVVTRVAEGGVPFAWLAALELRPRAGAERFQAGLLRPPRSLKKQYQQAGVPEWERDGPLVYSGGQLVFVPGLGIDARVMAAPGQPQAMLAWERGNPAAAD